jgi:hypothetical protein
MGFLDDSPFQGPGVFLREMPCAGATIWPFWGPERWKFAGTGVLGRGDFEGGAEVFELNMLLVYVVAVTNKEMSPF